MWVLPQRLDAGPESWVKQLGCWVENSAFGQAVADTQAWPLGAKEKPKAEACQD